MWSGPPGTAPRRLLHLPDCPMNARIPAYRRASLDAFHQGQCVASQRRRIDALVRGQIRPEFDQGLTQLTKCARRVAALAVIGTHGYVNQRLQEEPAGAAFRGPCLLQHFVALEKLAIIEQLDSAAQEWI